MTPITHLKPGEIFVFGSNLAGRHGAGAAHIAKFKFGAEPGVGVGITGQCYAIPTKDAQLKTMPLDHIMVFVSMFIFYALKHPEHIFLVTPIGCGLAGYKPGQIAPMFLLAPYNVILPPEFVQVLDRLPDERG